MSGAATSASYESKTFGMPCFDANASARLRSRAATPTTSASLTLRAGLHSAAGVMRAAPRVPIRSVAMRGTVRGRHCGLHTCARRPPHEGCRPVSRERRRHTAPSWTQEAMARWAQLDARLAHVDPAHHDVVKSKL